MSERVLENQHLLDALLEFKFHHIERSSPETLVTAFLAMRRDLERCEFLLAFRLRQWLENQIAVRVNVPDTGFASHRPLKLQGNSLRHVYQNYQREIFENDLLVSGFEDIEISLSWTEAEVVRQEEALLRNSY
ncbi:MAG: hypothetical protein AAGJ79_07775 [Verrucomicrobiota bacterium]